jgi:hypothetical protein
VAQVQQAVPVGPESPPANLPAGLSRRGRLWYFVSDRSVFCVDGRTGILAGLWDRATGSRCLAASADHYWLETATATTEADELDDQVNFNSRSGIRYSRARPPSRGTEWVVKEHSLIILQVGQVVNSKSPKIFSSSKKLLSI